ncbi:hypothetical protein Q8F57_045635 [Paraburkholderia terrae]|uniref:hypothetical protein n=1 Tax=Paraburkholderia terrae TaxID=311230 RepID=UPI00296AEC6D|nr:hypothetical protein [Paraburkholderia terrae]MDW3660667.1 hypothetical protein [Paraburkholderia terrae]
MGEDGLPCVPFSDGEIAFYRRFIREPVASRSTMLRTIIERWGFCERHAFGLLTVSASIPRSGMNTAAVLFLHTTANAITTLDRQLAGISVGTSMLSNSDQCPMCELGFDEASPGFIRRQWLSLPNSLERLQALMNSTRESWQRTVCSDCGGPRGGITCRRHLAVPSPAEADDPDRVDLGMQRSFLEGCRRKLERYLLTFGPDGTGEEVGEGVAALVSAAGWCCGWRTLLIAVGYSGANV